MILRVCFFCIHNAARLKSWDAELHRLGLKFEKLTAIIAG